MREPIAIVGIGCRFPGGANTPGAFWELLSNGVDAIGEIPGDRFDVDAFYDPRPATPGRIVTRWGGFLASIDRFDAAFFGMAPREAERLDPQQRLLLETAWESLEDAGYPPERLVAATTGVFVGMWLNDYEARMFTDPARVDFYMSIGSGRYSASGRISYAFGFQGPSITIDTACSSSLVAVHLACQSIWSGECAVALAGGANVILQPHITVAYSQAQMLAPDGRCKFGDSRANGFVRSEGAAVVTLKPLAQAQADGDPIYAVILGSAVTNDGRSSGFLATPGQPGHEEMLRRAYAAAGVDPHAVHYVEAHGTGTSAGDPVELGALGSVLGAGRSADKPCIVGSVKTNIGHTEGAAGVAGLIKVALSLKHKQIPATLHLHEPNTAVAWDDLRLVVRPDMTPWPADGRPAIGGVSSFGIAGTNAHVVLQEAPRLESAPSTPASDDDRPHLLALSARSAGALRALARGVQDLVAARASSLADLSYTAAVRRAHHDHRLAVVARNHEELIAQLDAFMATDAHDGMAHGQTGEAPPRVVFVFSGQGAQWPGMARRLLAEEPIFRRAMERCDRTIREATDWSLIDQLTAETGARLDDGDIDVVQPALFAIQVSLAALWRAWGIEPAAVVGHSMGEVAAAHVAGILSLEDAVAVICHRSRLLRRISGQGTMAAVELTLDQARAAIAGYEDRLAIAVSNSPTSTVLSGDAVALDEVLEQLQRRDVFCRHIKVDVASHSPQVDSLRDELIAALSGLRPQAATTPFLSTVTAAFEDGRGCDARYWERNLRQPVLFADAVRRLLDDGHAVFVEISPHPILLPSIERTCDHLGRHGQVVPSIRRDCDESATMRASLGRLYTFGCPVNWQSLHPAGGRVVKLPPYPWQRERFWYNADDTDTGRTSSRVRGGHPLLGTPIALAALPDTRVWENTVDLATFAFLGDHRVRSTALLPATGYVELALTAAEQVDGPAVQGDGPAVLEQLMFKDALGFADDGAHVLQVALARRQDGSFSFRVFSRPDKAGSERAWTLHAVGTLRRERVEESPPGEAIEQILERCPEEETSADYYAEMCARGLEYGPAFRAITRLWRGDGEALATLATPTAASGPGGRHAERITLLDGALQVAVAAMPGDTVEGTYVPIHVASVRVYRWPAPGEQLWSHVIRREGAAMADEPIYDVALRDGAGRALVECRALALRRLADDAALKDTWFYDVGWEERERTAPATVGRGSWLVFTAGAFGDELARLLTARGDHVIQAAPGASFRKLGENRYQIAPSDPDGYQWLTKEALGSDGPVYTGVIHAWSAGMPPNGDPLAAQALGVGSAVLLTQAIGEAAYPAPPRLWLVTAGAQAVETGDSPAPAQAPLWGLGRVIANEHAELRCTLVDATAETLQALVDEVLSNASDDQVALRGERRLVARLLPRPPASQDSPGLAAPGVPYRLLATTPGVLDSLELRVMPRRAPGPGEIEIAIDAAGLNFIDVMKALGICPGFAPAPDVALGGECAGRVVAVGTGVTGFAVGDDVVALTPSFKDTSCFASHVTVPALFAAPRPEHLPMEEAAGAPIAFLTAYYALHTLGRMQRGEQVLIHAAAGGVGLAAVQLARRAGAEVFATAGSEEKRAFLRSLGVAHVFDSRTLAFTEEVLSATGGRGVDVVLNSLSGEAIPRSLACLAPRGRFLEIGKRDIYDNTAIGLEPFKRNLSFFAIDLASMAEQSPQYVARLFQELMALFAAGELQPIPTRAYAIDDVADAFRHMAQARHVGKIVAVMRGREPEVRLDSAIVRPDATYLITGGLGALGLAVAGRLAERGARHVALMGRGAPSAESLATIERIERSGTRVAVIRGDVASETDVVRVLAEIDASMPPLRGVIHAAGLLADTTVAQMDGDRLRATLEPKVAGAWHLHCLTRDRQLDHFILFSSVAALLGSPGQGNYAAGNAFLDALAQARRVQGLPGLSIAWGPWSGIGLAAARSDRGARLALRGVGSIAPRDGLAALEGLMAAPSTYVAVMPFDPHQWRAAYPGAAASSLLAGLYAGEPAARESGPQLRKTLLAVEPGQRRRGLLEGYLREELAQVLRLPRARIASDQSFKTMGLDSLMAIEFTHRLGRGAGLALSATLAWNYPTITALAEHIAGRMEIPLDAPAAATTEAAAITAQDAELANLTQDGELANLTQDAVAALLSDELDAIDDLLRDG